MLSRKINFSINLIELKYRTIYFFISFFFTFFICFLYRVELFFIISNSFLDYEKGFIYTNLLDPIIIYLKLALLFSLIFVLPYFIYIFSFFFFKSFYNFYTFFYFYYLLLLYIFLTLFFLVFTNYFFPVFFKFLLTFQRISFFEVFELQLQATINQYYNFFFTFILFYFLISCLPNSIFLLIINNIIAKEFFIKYLFRKYLYLFILSIFFVFAPPDFLLQLIILPFIIFFLELFIYIVSFFFCLYYSK